MEKFQTFAVAGAGGMGGEILKALLSHTRSVRVLTRNTVQAGASEIEKLAQTGRPTEELTKASEGVEKRFPEGVEVARVDYESEESLLKALAGVDVVVSALREGGFAVQKQLALAAKKAGVRLFVPSEYGVPTIGRTADTSVAIELKISIEKMLREIELPSAVFFNGLWMEYWPMVTGFPVKGKMTIVGSGNVEVSTTARPDAARFVGYALANLPVSELQDKVFRVEGDRKTMNQIHVSSLVGHVNKAIFEKKSGRRIEVVYLDTDETMAEALDPANDPAMYVEWLMAVFDRGEGVCSFDPATGNHDVPLDNKLWPEWNPKKVEEYFGKL